MVIQEYRFMSTLSEFFFVDLGIFIYVFFVFIRENLIGIILMQDLLVNDPADKLPLRSVHGYFKRRIAKCTVNDKLDRIY